MIVIFVKIDAEAVVQRRLTFLSPANITFVSSLYNGIIINFSNKHTAIIIKAMPIVHYRSNVLVKHKREITSATFIYLFSLLLFLQFKIIINERQCVFLFTRIFARIDSMPSWDQ